MPIASAQTLLLKVVLLTVSHQQNTLSVAQALYSTVQVPLFTELTAPTVKKCFADAHNVYDLELQLGIAVQGHFLVGYFLCMASCNRVAIAYCITSNIHGIEALAMGNFPFAFDVNSGIIDTPLSHRWLFINCQECLARVQPLPLFSSPASMLYYTVEFYHTL